MRPRDFAGGTDPDEADRYREALAAWERRRDELAAAHAAAAAALVAAQARLPPGLWLDQLQGLAGSAFAQASAVTVAEAELAAVAAGLPQVEGELADHHAAREVATARLLGGAPAEIPVVLFPLRLETRWIEGTLHVRIYPDDLQVNTHDAELSADESTWGRHYWQARAGTVAAAEEPTWQQLARRFGPQRAAWVVAATDPAQPPAALRTGTWPRPARVDLMPARFAVVALAGGEPVNLAAPGAPPRFVTWGGAVPDPLDLGRPVAPADSAEWTTDPVAARQAGMAVSIAVPAGAPPFDMVIAIGLRGQQHLDADGARLAELLLAQAFTGGAEVLADGTPTNNSDAVRSAHSPQRQGQVARALLTALLDNPDAALPDGSAGAQLGDLLGLDRATLAPMDGSATTRAGTTQAARSLVGRAVVGALETELGAAAAAVWALLQPDGPGPAIRVGRQPYGVLPATAPGRWRPRDGELTAALTPLLHRWALATGPLAATDPGAPPVPIGGGAARRATATDDRDLATLLLESPSASNWSAGTGGPGFDGLDGLVGPHDGAHSPAAVLQLVAATAPADLPALPPDALPATLLARIAVAAKEGADLADGPAVDAALLALAGVEREQLAALIGGFLDAASHRFDPWVTAAATERLLTSRAARPGAVALGAFGWVTDVGPRTEPRSHGHVHAPSLGHAVTAAVLRSAFLGQRRARWAEEVRLAEIEVATARDVVEHTDPSDPSRQFAVGDLGRARTELGRRRHDATALAPLDAATEARLPMALDLSSQRVREALWVLGAVRGGQPLAAVLGYQFERDLADAGLQRYLAAFRKLTRFRTGTALEQVEEDRRNRRTELVTAESRLAKLTADAAALQPAVDAAAADEQAGRDRLARAETAAAPFAGMPAELSGLTSAAIPALEQALAAINARMPRSQRQHFTIQVP